MKRFILCMMSTGALLHAGLTDFKTIKEANQAYEAKEYGKSAALLNSLDIKSPQKQYDIGNALYKDKKYDEAIQAYEKAEGVDEATRLYNIGNSQFQKKELDKAIESYGKALKLKEDEDTKFNLELAKKQKKKEEQKKQDQKDQEKKDEKENDKEQNKDDKQNQDQKQNKNQKDQDKKKEDQKNKDQNKKQDKQKKDEKDGKNKEDGKKKEGEKKKSDSQKDKKPQDKKGEEEGSTSKVEKKKSKEEKLKEQELKRLMKKMQKGKTPTMMYQMGEGKKVKGVKMRNLGKVLVILAVSFQYLWSASVEAKVSSMEVVSGNAVQLRITATGDNVKFPDIQTIDGYNVQGTHTGNSSSYSYVNGSMKSQHSTTKTLTFFPTKNMTIPSYEVEIEGKGYKTKPIAISIVKSNAPTGQNNDMFSLQMRANKSKVMVGESLMVTVYFSLKNGVRLSQEVQYTPPSFPGFIVADAGEQNAYIKGNYQIQEVRYILTPQAEGNFTATPAHAKVGVADRSRRDIFGMSFGTKWKQMRSNSLEIEVLPQEKESDLVGAFTVDTTIDAQEVKANKPVNLTVKIEGKGNLESFEFPKYEIDGVTVYSDEAKVETKVVDGELYSSYSKSFAFISEEDFRIPARSFSVLTPQDHQIKALDVNAYDIKIKKIPTTSSPTVNTQTNGMVQTKIAQPLQTKEVTVAKQVEVKSVAWWMLAVAFGLGMLFMFILRWLPSLTNRNASPYKESEALKILYGHMSEDAEIEEMVRKLYARKNGDKSVEIDKKVLKEMVERFR